MVSGSDIEVFNYREAFELPKFKASLNTLLNKKACDFILSAHSIDKEELLQFVERATEEGNAVLIQREWNGYMVIVWRD